MRTCTFICTAVSANGYPGAVETETVCYTHSYRFRGLFENGRCPIGQIEDVVDSGVKRIEAALADIHTPTSPVDS